MATSVIDLLKKNEGFSGTIYNDTGGVPTIGYGFTAMVLDGKDGRPKFSDYKNKEMTEEEANDLLVNKIVPYFERQLRNKLNDYDGLAENQRAAIVDLAYRNGVAGLGKSGVYDAINKGDFEEATNIIRDSKDLQKENSVVLQPGDKAYKGITGRNAETANVFSGMQTATPRTKSSSVNVDPSQTPGTSKIPGTNRSVDQGTKEIAGLVNRNRMITANYDDLQEGDAAAIQAAEQNLREVFTDKYKRDWKDEKGLTTTKKGDTESFRGEANSIIFGHLSEGLDPNTPSGAETMKRRIRGYLKLVKDPTYKENVAAAYEMVIPETVSKSELAYIDLIEDSTWSETFLTQSSAEYTGIKPDLISYPHVDQQQVAETVNAAVKQIAANNPDVRKRILEGDLEGVKKDYIQGVYDSVIKGEMLPDAVTTEGVANIISREEQPKKEKERTLQDAIDEGEALELEDEEIEEEESMESLGLNEDGSQKPKDSTESQEKMRKAEKVLSGLKAAAGILSLSKALRDPEIETPELSPLITEAVDKQRQLSKSGLTAAEKSAAMSNLDNAYAGAMKNVLRASGGQRGMFLAGQGVVDANRIQGLNQLAAQDAAVRQQNVQQYNALASSVGQMQLQRDMSVEQMKQATMQKNRDVLGGIGTNLVSDAISDVSWYLNPNRDLIEQAQRTNLEGIAGVNQVPYDASKSATVGLASTSPNTKLTEQEKQLQKQKNKTK